MRYWLLAVGLWAALTTPQAAADGSVLFAPCSACHSLQVDAPAGIGPHLADILNRPVASVKGFDYSAVFQMLGGRWDRARLDAFLTNPQTYAPGTKMIYPGVVKPADRKALIDYLADPKSPPPAQHGRLPPGPGAVLTYQKCTACHSELIVMQQGLSRPRWEEMLEWMVEEQGMPVLSADDRQIILSYLTTHFSR